MGMLVGVGDDTEPVLPRSTASQMQRGSGELQSTPTGFWKLQSDPAAGHGSIAAGIGAWGLLRSTSLTAHMGCTHTHTRNGRGQSPDVEIQKIKPGEDGVVLVELLSPRLRAPIHRCQKSLIPQVPHHSLLLLSSANQPLSHTFKHSESPEEAEGRLLGSRWRSVCGTGIRGRSGFTTDTHREQLTASLPLVSGDVLHTKPLCPPPKHILLSQRAGSSDSPPSHCPLSLSPSLLSFYFPPSLALLPNKSLHLTLIPQSQIVTLSTSSVTVSLLFSFAFSSFLVFVNQS